MRKWAPANPLPHLLPDFVHMLHFLKLEHARPIWAIDLIWAAELAQTL